VNVVGFDTATDDTIVAASRAGETVFEEIAGPGADGRPSHSATLLPALDRAAGELGGWHRVDRIAVGVGPGTFTGLRIGVATALGLGLSTGASLVAVPTLAALAAGLAGSGSGELRVPVLDARRGEVFAAVYDSSGEELQPAAAFRPEECARMIGRLERPASTGGPGAVRFAQVFERGGVRQLMADPGASLLSGSAVCELGATLRPLRQGEPLEPIYIRTPDARLWLERDAEPGG
jgi:tRNA threonylcarbamoyladenosine biosynthesis protein TsaB